MVWEFINFHNLNITLLVNLTVHEHVGTSAGRVARRIVRAAAAICFLDVVTCNL
jgi:hypothetical protein